MPNKVTNFFKEVAVEGRKVDWPSREQAINYTILVIAISGVVAALLGILDAIFFKILIH